MDEKTWLDSHSAGELYSVVWPLIGERKAALWVVACARFTPLPEPNELIQRAADAVEFAADREAEQVTALHLAANRACQACSKRIDTAPHFLALAALRLTTQPIGPCAWHVPLFLRNTLTEPLLEASVRRNSDGLAKHYAMKALEEDPRIVPVVELHAALLRDIVGNPFRMSLRREGRRKRKEPPRASIEKRWLTPAVRGLAEEIYSERSFDLMPILGDALSDAGCDRDDVLSHCREPIHVRGCWVVDLVLGKW